LIVRRHASIPPTGILESYRTPRKTLVSKTHFPKSDPVSAQAVALGGRPLKKETVVAGEEGDEVT